MPVHHLRGLERVRGRAFGPDDITVLVTAFEGTLRDLRMGERTDPEAVMLVAKRVIDLAKEGEHDPMRLRKSVLRSFRPPSPHS